MRETNSRTIILEKALQLFRKKSYEGTSISEICEAASITKPTLYYFFSSKYGLLEAINDEYGTLFLKTISEAATYRHQFYDSLKSISCSIVEFAANYSDFFCFMSLFLQEGEDTEPYQAFMELKKNLDQTLLQFFADSSNEFGNMKGHEQFYSTLFLSSILALAKTIQKESIEEKTRLIELFCHSLIYGFAN